MVGPRCPQVVTMVPIDLTNGSGKRDWIGSPFMAGFFNVSCGQTRDADVTYFHLERLAHDAFGRPGSASQILSQ